MRTRDSDRSCPFRIKLALQPRMASGQTPFVAVMRWPAAIAADEWVDAALAGSDPGRAAKLLVTPALPGSGRRGSGYRVSPSAVLTSGHPLFGNAGRQVPEAM